MYDEQVGKVAAGGISGLARAILDPWFTGVTAAEAAAAFGDAC